MTRSLRRAGLLCATLLAFSGASSASTAPVATRLPVTASLGAALVRAAAPQYGLTPRAFLGVVTKDTYYAIDHTTTTYYAGASLRPNPHNERAVVSQQDDGSYIIFVRRAGGRWVAHLDGLAGIEGSTCAKDHATVPPAVLAVWHWRAGTCRPLGA